MDWGQLGNTTAPLERPSWCGRVLDCGQRCPLLGTAPSLILCPLRRDCLLVDLLASCWGSDCPRRHRSQGVDRPDLRLTLRDIHEEAIGASPLEDRIGLASPRLLVRFAKQSEPLPLCRA